MKATGRTRAIRKAIEQEIVDPLFDQLDTPANGALPAVVARNRRARARDRVIEALVSRGSANVPPALKRQIETLVAAWAARAFEDGYPDIEQLEIQCAEERDLVIARESGNPEKVLAVLEASYRKRVIEEFGSIELRGIQVSHRVHMDLSEVFVPLYLQEIGKSPESSDELTLLSVRRKVDEVLERQRRLLILGSPGGGKSTLVGWLASKYARENTLLPFVVVVRTLRAAVEFTPQWLAAHAQLELAIIEAALEKGRAALLVDGIDEATPEMRKELFASMDRLGRAYREATIVATSRPTGGKGEFERGLPQFSPQFQLADLIPSEVDEFVDKWCLAADKSVLKDSAEAARQSKKAADDLKGRISRSRPVQRLAVNPLLVTILCVVHRFLGRSIPEHRVTLYEKCTDALLYEWDRAKFQEGARIGELDAKQKRRLLRPIARTLHERHEAEIPEPEVVEIFKSVLPQIGRTDCNPADLVREIRDRSGILIERRPGFFGFSHLSFQEYLTALDFAASKQWDELADLWMDPWWHEVIVLAAGVEGADSDRLTSRLLSAGGHTGLVLAAQCLETAVDVPISRRKEIEQGLDKLIPPTDVDTLRSLLRVGALAAPLLLKAIDRSTGSGLGFTLFFLAHTAYDPAMPRIASLVSDQSLPPDSRYTAARALADATEKSEAACRVLREIIRQSPPAEVLNSILGALEHRHDPQALEIRGLATGALKSGRKAL